MAEKSSERNVQLGRRSCRVSERCSACAKGVGKRFRKPGEWSGSNEGVCGSRDNDPQQGQCGIPKAYTLTTVGVQESCLVTFQFIGGNALRGVKSFVEVEA